jgi:predicted acyltransferase
MSPGEMRTRIGMTDGKTQDKGSAGPAGAGRLESLDVFRGATIAAMMLVNNPGTWDAVYPQLRHAEWNGWTFTDLVFPFFLWIVGVAMTLSFARRVARGESKSGLMLHALRRSLILFALGLFLSSFPYFDISMLRIPGVLQRIAVCYLCATVIFLNTRIRGQILWTGGLLAVYWMAMKWIPIPGFGAGILEKNGNFAQYVDSLLLKGHMWAATRTWDPEGIVSTIPAIGTTLLGILTGHILRARWSPAEKTAWMYTMGSSLALAGLTAGIWLPINKNLWTSSYTLFMAGMATTTFAFCYWINDVKGYRRWSRPFAVYGMNAIAVYFLAGILARTTMTIKVPLADGTVSLRDYIYAKIFAPLASPMNASMLHGIAFVLLMYLVAYLMYRRKWFVKI